MSTFIDFDDDLARQLPLPLAQLYRRAHNSKSTMSRHHAAFYLWEAALKLLGSVAIVAYAEQAEPAPELNERLENLARPALGHWWDFVRRLVPLLAERGDPGFTAARDLVLGRMRSDLPRAAGLDAALRESLDGQGGARAGVRFSELIDRLVHYRSREFGHGAMRPDEYYGAMGASLLSAALEVLEQLDVLAGRDLVYVQDGESTSSGGPALERFRLIGEARRRLAPQTRARSELEQRPVLPGRIYLEVSSDRRSASTKVEAPVSLHPLLVYDDQNDRVFFYLSRRGREQCEYLDYVDGTFKRENTLDDEHRPLLIGAMGGVDHRHPPADAQELAGPPDGASQTSADSVPPASPRQIAEFALLARLGTGGMGVVYRALQLSLDRQVALKVVLRAGDLKAEARFAREIHALGRVDHPHVTKIFTSGIFEESWFYAMELVEGATLNVILDKLNSGGMSARALDLDAWRAAVSQAYQETRSAETPLSDQLPHPIHEGHRFEQFSSDQAGWGSYVSHAVALVRQTAEAAHALHEAGVLHRDIKPGNIMVTSDGTQAVLIDLGLAQLVGEEGNVTRTRQFVGTLRYASPEQILSSEVDRRTDVYSLGATLWELLTLRPLFDAAEQTATADLMMTIQFTDPQSPRRLNPQVSKDLEAIVLRCLEKDRSRRYESAAELVADLDRWRRSEPVLARRPSFRYLLARYVRRHPVPVSLGMGLVLSMLLSISMITWQETRHRHDQLLLRETRRALEMQRVLSQKGMVATVPKNHVIGLDPSATRTVLTAIVNGHVRAWDAETGIELATRQAKGTVDVVSSARDDVTRANDHEALWAPIMGVATVSLVIGLVVGHRLRSRPSETGHRAAWSSPEESLARGATRDTSTEPPEGETPPRPAPDAPEVMVEAALLDSHRAHPFDSAASEPAEIEPPPALGVPDAGRDGGLPSAQQVAGPPSETVAEPANAQVEQEGVQTTETDGSIGQAEAVERPSVVEVAPQPAPVASNVPPRWEPRPVSDDEAFSSQVVLLHYPTPIAHAYRKFCNEKEPKARLIELVKTLERTLRYLTYLGVSDLLHCLAEDDAELPEHEAFGFLREPTKMTLGYWAGALSETAEVLEEYPRRFIEELPRDCAPGSFLDEALDGIIRDRNRAEHIEAATALTRQESEDFIHEHRPRLERALHAVRFLRRYPLGFVTRGSRVAGKTRYRLHTCMGRYIPTSHEALVIEAPAQILEGVPFVVAPDDSRLLYLWPMLLQREPELSSGPSLYVFETSKTNHLTRARFAAIDVRDPWEEVLHEQHAVDHRWLRKRLREEFAPVTLGAELELTRALTHPRIGLLAGRTLGPHNLLYPIARGASGTIYDARTLEDGQRVAVKVLESADAEALFPRFRREYVKLQQAGRDHPGIIHCYAADSSMIEWREYHWYSMEFAAGDLSMRISERAREIALRRKENPRIVVWDDLKYRSEVIEEFSAIVAAVKHLHHLNIIHRDIKPGNVLVMDDGELRLSDFGLVKDIGPEQLAITLVPPTSLGSPVGTMDYMAPEQASGEHAEKSADVYSLGIVLAELAIGTRPRHRLELTLGSTLQNCTELTLLDRPLARFIRRCTEARPARRPKDAAAVLEGFQQVLSVVAQESPGPANAGGSEDVQEPAGG